MKAVRFRVQDVHVDRGAVVFMREELERVGQLERLEERRAWWVARAGAPRPVDRRLVV